MNLNTFTMLVHAARYNLYPAVMMKLGMEQALSQFLVAGAPAGAPPTIKQSYLRFKVYRTIYRLLEQKEKKLHIGLNYN